MADGIALNCRRCPSFCCKMAGQVEVSMADRKRLAKRLGLTLTQFDEKHTFRDGRRKQKLIKHEYATCQFLSETRSCTVYDSRPRDCRGYVCWDQDDKTVYEFAVLAQVPMKKIRRLEAAKEDE